MQNSQSMFGRPRRRFDVSRSSFEFASQIKVTEPIDEMNSEMMNSELEINDRTKMAQSSH